MGRITNCFYPDERKITIWYQRRCYKNSLSFYVKLLKKTRRNLSLRTQITGPDAKIIIKHTARPILSHLGPQVRERGITLTNARTPPVDTELTALKSTEDVQGNMTHSLPSSLENQPRQERHVEVCTLHCIPGCRHERSDAGEMTRCCMCYRWHHDDCIGSHIKAFDAKHDRNW